LTLSRWHAAGRPKISIFFNNLLGDDDHYPSGYSWQYIERDSTGNDTVTGIPFYYPLATRNFVVTMDFTW
jgi:hypothetical protein